MYFNNILWTIGNTPMVKINRMNCNPNVALYAKLEGFNPTGSIKDRIALKMIEEAEINGELTKEKIIIEATSGNTGIGLSMIGRVKGYRVQIVMSALQNHRRRNMDANTGYYNPFRVVVGNIGYADGRGHGTARKKQSN